MIPIGIEIVGLNEVLQDLNRIDRGLESMRPMFESFGTEFRKEEVDVFAAARFVALDPNYAKRKRSLFGNKPILQATGKLLKSFTEQGAEGNISRIEDLSAEFGSADPKALLHHTGTSRMHVRDPLAKPDEDRYMTLAGEYLDKLIGN